MAEWQEVGEDVWNFDIGKLRIKVHRHTDEEKDKWICTCYELDRYYIKLNNNDLDKAKLEALYWASGKLAEYKMLCNALCVICRDQEVQLRRSDRN